jgi:fluoride exporter
VTTALWLGVGVVSGLAAVARFLVHAAVQRWSHSPFPFGTLAVNVLGSLALGVHHGAGVTGDALLLTGTALLGSFTTFSTWMLETERLREQGESGLATANVLVGLALGLVAVALGWALGAAF